MIDIDETFAWNEKYIVRTFLKRALSLTVKSISHPRSTTTNF